MENRRRRRTRKEPLSSKPPLAEPIEGPVERRAGRIGVLLGVNRREAETPVGKDIDP